MGEEFFNLEPCNGGGECFRCGATEELFKDPNIEGLCFCKECWRERQVTERLTQLGMDEEIPFDE